MNRRSLTATVALAALTLTGCAAAAPEEDPATPPPPAAEQPQEPAPTPAPEPAPSAPAWPESAAAPECEDLLDPAWATNLHAEIDGPDTEGEVEPYWIIGPAAQEAYDASLFLTGCRWGIYQSDGTFSVHVMATAPEVQAPLTDALAASDAYLDRDDGYVSSDGTKAMVYSRDVTYGIGMGYAHAFHSGHWVVASGTLLSPDRAAEVANMAMAATVETD
ncbi:MULTISPECIES: hypothetical protein [unclassified Microbacterium]|uniref:hypothetical protein n=1 Tax=unclassified Microbacterium TaxID=2609290 RepID=UPI00214C09CF|nr:MULTISPECIES: hypothetical protein [unclassified Microbacterium]MCR2800385.1 hypothetical protein [Microbacterium sp. zg.Y818]MCR2825888.1 hypothetical protein [Microbacterium sp. zg.Y909]WIM22345.1 hypothetical protein QNO21_14750 [Microbacterium sp. zg-Y818]